MAPGVTTASEDYMVLGEQVIMKKIPIFSSVFLTNDFYRVLFVLFYLLQCAIKF